MNFNISIDSNLNPFDALKVLSPDSDNDISKIINLDNEKLAKIFLIDKGTIVPTPYLKYIFAAQAKASFARWIVEKDLDKTYHSASIAQIADPKAYEEFMNNGQKEKNDVYQHEYEIQRDLHNDWFEDQESVENIADYTYPFINSDKIYIPEGIGSIVDGYKFANGFLKDFKDKDKLPKTVKRVVSKEYKEDWSVISDKLKKEYDYKTKAEVEAILIKNGNVIDDVKTRLTLNRKPPEDKSQINLFCENFMRFLLERDFS